MERMRGWPLADIVCCVIFFTTNVIRPLLIIQLSKCLQHANDGSNSKTGACVCCGWLFQSWNDMLLRWNKDLFGGVDHVRVPIDRIWTPDIVLYN